MSHYVHSFRGGIYSRPIKSKNMRTTCIHDLHFEKNNEKKEYSIGDTRYSQFSYGATKSYDKEQVREILVGSDVN